MFPGLDLYYTVPAQRLITAGQDLDDLDHDLSVRGAQYCTRLSRSLVAMHGPRRVNTTCTTDLGTTYLPYI